MHTLQVENEHCYLTCFTLFCLILYTNVCSSHDILYIVTCIIVQSNIDMTKKFRIPAILLVFLNP